MHPSAAVHTLIYDVPHVLELACAAFRRNNDYVKTSYHKLIDNETQAYQFIYANKTLIGFTLGHPNFGSIGPNNPLIALDIIEEDKVMASAITKYFRKLTFTMLTDQSNEFLNKLYHIFSDGKVKVNDIGYVACLPSVYEREKEKLSNKKIMNTCDDEPLAQVGSSVRNVKCTIISCKLSTTYMNYATTGIVDNKIVSWWSKELVEGDVVITSAKVKKIGKNYSTKKTETCLHYVRIK